jgi:cytochrome c-type biogenesis protein
MAIDVSSGAAVLAGALSFLSPCVLPLVPSYLVYVSGVSLEDMTSAQPKTVPANMGRVMLAALLFVLGFSTVFVLMGATASALGAPLRTYQRELSIAAGIIIIIMGLHFMGLFRIGFLEREARFQTNIAAASHYRAYIVGLAFAFGWVPCIGPVLQPILILAGAEETVRGGMALLALYSLGLGIPFLVSALSVNSFLIFFRNFRRHLPKVEKIMGALLVLTGIMFLTGWMQNMSYWLLENAPWLATFG